MVEPRTYVDRNPSVGRYGSEHHRVYATGQRYRIVCRGMFGVKDNEVVPICTPYSEPYLLLNVKLNTKGYKRWVLAGENGYHDLVYNRDRVKTTYTPRSVAESHQGWEIVAKSGKKRLGKTFQVAVQQIWNDVLTKEEGAVSQHSPRE